MPNMIHDPENATAQASARARLTVALAGNPNSGKTTIFNALTGARQHVGNYPGVTVEKVEGTSSLGGREVRIIDLPGTYSLSAYSMEELVARNYLIDERPDVVVCILDASNLERNLYLAVQLLEMDIPLVLAFNMWDLADQRGWQFDLVSLEKRLGVPIVPTVGHKKSGVRELLARAVEVAEGSGNRRSEIAAHYRPEVEAHLQKIADGLRRSDTNLNERFARWIAIKLLEGDQVCRQQYADHGVLEMVRSSALSLERELDEDLEALFAVHRYDFISHVCSETVRQDGRAKGTWSDRIDAVATHRALGLPIFLAMMYAVFQLTFTLGEPPMGWIESGFGWLGETIGSWWPTGSESLLKSLLVDGIIGGVGGVLVFLPNILLLFLAISVLEDSGYMARAAFLMDRLMNKIGLHGKSFIPMLIGFGCSIPAIMATRTLENHRDRITTMMVIPLMSCGARLPIYALIIPAFFPQVWQAPMLWLIYIIGIVLAVISAKLLKMTVLKGEVPPFVMELPPYRRPTVKSVLLHMWNRGGANLKKAGTIILGISVVLWAMQQWPGLPAEKAEAFETQRQEIVEQSGVSEEAMAQQLAALNNAEAEAALEASLMGRLGNVLEPVLRPCGFDWKISTAMVGAFAAKEVFVSQMGIVYSLGDEEDEGSQPLRAQLQANYTPLQGFCIMLFCLISAPCMATVAVTRRESNSWGWALLQLAGLTALAWIVTVAVYQIGSVMG